MPVGWTHDPIGFYKRASLLQLTISSEKYMTKAKHRRHDDDSAGFEKHRRRYDTLEKILMYSVCAFVSSVMAFGVKVVNESVNQTKAIQVELTLFRSETNALKNIVTTLAKKQDVTLSRIRDVELIIAGKVK